MRYFVKKGLEIARFILGWRLILVVLTVALGAIAVSTESALLAVAAAIPALVLYAVSGTRTAANHAAINRIRASVDSSPSTPATAPAAQPTKKTAAKPAEPRRQAISHERPETPEVTVVVTAFNEHKHILDCLRTIQDQTWSNFECVVIDDASTDSTIELAYEEFCGDSRFEFVSLRSNVGLSTARNLGTELARAPWITYVDGDDFLYPS